MISFPFHIWMSNKQFNYMISSVKKTLIYSKLSPFKFRNLKTLFPWHAERAGVVWNDCFGGVFRALEAFLWAF